jgi:hypothetical protein
LHCGRASRPAQNCTHQHALPIAALQPQDDSGAKTAGYFGGAGGGAKISRLCPGSGFGFGLGAFFVSFLPLSLFPMFASMTQKRASEKPRMRIAIRAESTRLLPSRGGAVELRSGFRLSPPRRVDDTLYMQWPLKPVDANQDAVAISPGPRFKAALILAILADVFQIIVFPLFVEGAASPPDDILDLGIAGVLTLLLGWHWEFAPSFLAKLVPGVDFVPLWTLAVANVYRKSKRAVVSAEASGRQPPAGTTPPY